MKLKQRKKRIALLLTAALVLTSTNMVFADEADIPYEDNGGSEYLPEFEADGASLDAELYKDADNSTITYGNNTIYIGGTGSVAAGKRETIIEAADGDEGNIHKISVGNGITHIGGGIFNGESNADDGGALPNLTELSFDSGHALDEIGRSSFAFNKALQTVTVNPGAKTGKDQGFEISHYAFRYCTALTNLTLNNVWHVGKRAFQGDTKITSVDLGYLHHMRGDAFEGCTSLSDIKVASDNPYFETGEDGYLYKTYCPYYESDGSYNIQVPALMAVPYTKAGETFKPAKGTKTIAYAAVVSNNNIKKAKAISGVKQIQARAFYNCKNLKEVYISRSVKHIGNEAFSKLDTEYDDYYYDATPDDYDKHAYYDDDIIDAGNVTDVYYGGSEEEWKSIVYDKYDTDMKTFTDGGKVADNLLQVGLSENVVIHYNYYDPDILMPDVVKSGGKLSVSCAVILAKSKNISIDTSFLGFTPTEYRINPIDSSPAKGIKINKKKWTLKAANKAGTYDIVLSSGSGSMTIRLYVEKPVMKKKTVELASDDLGTKYNVSTMLSGITYLEPDKYESKKTAVATIADATGTITTVKKGSTKIIATICDKKFKANFKIKVKKASKSKD